MPYRDPKTKQIAPMPAWDPHASYKITALNEEYQGRLRGVSFVEGVAIVRGLAKDADDEAIADRLETLCWFWNADGAWKPVVNDEGKVVRREWRPVYTIELDDMPARSSKREPVGAA